jgi:hypothetical protein
MKSILAALAASLLELKNKANSALSGMQPLDQYAAAQEVTYAVKSLQYSEKVVTEMIGQAEAILSKYDTEIETAAASRAEVLLTEKLAAGEYLPKADVDAAVALSRKEGKDEAVTEFAAAKAAAEKVAARRTEIAAVTSPEAAALIPDEALTEESFAATKLEFKRRFDAVTEIGVTAAEKKDAFADFACSMGFGEDSGKAFDSRISVIRDIAKPAATGTAAASVKTKVPGSTVPLAAGAATTDAPAKANIGSAAF